MIKTKPDLKFNQLWNISFGFFGVQIAFALQQANISGIFSTLGVDLDKIGYFWIVPPLMGMIVQPLVGLFSDKTWNRFGRRLPWLIVGTLIAVLVMTFLPNSGNLGLAANAVFFCVVMFMLLDTSINMAMQPFKMMVGDMVNEKQKAKAYSIQSLLCNAGALVGNIAPFALAAIGIANVADPGVIPDSVKWSFYIGAAIMVVCVLYTFFNVKEYNPQQMKEFREAALTEENATQTATGNSHSKKAIRVFIEVAVVQFFCWIAFTYMWTYTNATISHNVWGTLDAATKGFQDARNWVGIVFAVQSAGSILWATVLPKFKNIKVGYIVSLLIGAAGFAWVPYVHNQYLLFVPYFLIGFAWAAMLAYPFTLVTNAFEGSKRMGTVLGIFNCSICLPQIVAASLSETLYNLVGGKLLPESNGNMLLLAGVLLTVGAVCVFLIEDKKHKQNIQ